MTMQTTKLFELMQDFEKYGINLDSSNNRFQSVLDFQDVIGRSTMTEICDTFKSMDKHDRGIFLWVACHCLDRETFMEILKKSVVQGMLEEESDYLNEAYNDRMIDIIEREKTMKALEIENAAMKEQIKHLEYLIQAGNRELAETREKAHKFDSIRNLLR